MASGRLSNSSALQVLYDYSSLSLTRLLGKVLFATAYFAYSHKIRLLAGIASARPSAFVESDGIEPPMPGTDFQRPSEATAHPLHILRLRGFRWHRHRLAYSPQNVILKTDFCLWKSANLAAG